MNKNYTRRYVHEAEAYYAKSSLPREGHVDEVMLGFYDSDGMWDHGEIPVRWYELDYQVVPRLEVFSENWTDLYQLQDVLAAMAGVEELITPKEFCALLDTLGFIDATKRERKK